jgi:hypothetical protein
MKRIVIPALIALALGAVAASAQANAGPGTVTISYSLFHPHWIASSQIAVWIEDGQGAYVATVFATDFMARRKGYIRRPQCCPEWVKASGLAGLPDASIDAISGATQKPGQQQLTWACTDAAGKPVPPGTYTCKVEGNISFEKRVLWEGRITVGSAAAASVAVPTYLPESARAAGTLVTDVQVKFQPSR